METSSSVVVGVFFLKPLSRGTAQNTPQFVWARLSRVGVWEPPGDCHTCGKVGPHCASISVAIVADTGPLTKLHFLGPAFFRIGVKTRHALRRWFRSNWDAESQMRAHDFICSTCKMMPGSYRLMSPQRHWILTAMHAWDPERPAAKAASRRIFIRYAGAAPTPSAPKVP